MKSPGFEYLIIGVFLFLLVLELAAVISHQFTISDFIFQNVRLKYRIAILAFLVYHFVFEYPTYR